MELWHKIRENLFSVVLNGYKALSIILLLLYFCYMTCQGWEGIKYVLEIRGNRYFFDILILDQT